MDHLKETGVKIAKQVADRKKALDDTLGKIN